MPKKQKKLKGVTFQLVHRSQQDPLVADETAPQRVLLPVSSKEFKADREKRLEEQHKYGIYFDDDYNYLQHLKAQDDHEMEWPQHIETVLENRRQDQAKEKLKLPSSVFASKVEEEIGMLNKATPVLGPQLHLDPDVVAAMDEDFDYDNPDNQLEDNFVELAQGIASDNEFNEEDEDNYCDSDDALDEIGSLKDPFLMEETKSRFTNYSMTSSVMKRNNQLSLLDERFEKMYQCYDEHEIGALDTEEIEGHVPESSEMLLKYAEEFEKHQKRDLLDKERVMRQLQKDSDEDWEEMRQVEINEEEKWDCETILSTYSNQYNHPKIIKEPLKNKIKVDNKTGIPKNVLDSNKLTINTLNQFDEQNSFNSPYSGSNSITGLSVISQLTALSIRNKGESSAEKKERKNALKEYRRERRLEKKINTHAFKEEMKRQVKIGINNRNNVQGNKIL
ncbi:protein LTV1 homolog [Euwallacea fornicatus]|uniref:protein LTV1 homolog n=1 Tax=Euwallacea fornicatus TaxID=995702 RepID=UPI00338F4E70